MRVSVTTLESYRLYLEADWMAEESLQQSIKGVFVATPEMILGRNLHSVLEDHDQYEQPDGSYLCKESRFSSELIRDCLVHVEPGVFEVKFTKDYTVGGRQIQVVGKVDELVGLRVVENKIRVGSFEAERYTESFQPRFYLDILQAQSVTFKVFILGESQEGLFLKSCEKLTVYPYPDLHDDCQRLVTRFVDYVERRQLESFFPAAQREIAWA